MHTLIFVFDIRTCDIRGLRGHKGVTWTWLILLLFSLLADGDGCKTYDLKILKYLTLLYEPRHGVSNDVALATSKGWIRLRFCAFWSEPLLVASTICRSPALHGAGVVVSNYNKQTSVWVWVYGCVCVGWGGGGAGLGLKS